MTIQYILSTRSLTFIDSGGVPHQVSRDSISFGDVVNELTKVDPDEAVLIELARPQAKIERELSLALDGVPNTQNYLAKRTVEVSREGVKLDGVPMHGVLVDRMMEMLGLGLPLGPLMKFMENLYMNPAEFARDELYLWLENSDLPITEDGCFLAYKRVSDNLTDLHTGRFDNSPGQIVQLAGRHVVDPIRDNTCSTGLHFCSKSYLPFFGSGGGNKVVLLKINPADVVSIPSDYDNAKGRTWRYEVLREVEADLIPTAVWAPVTGNDGGAFSPEPVLNESGYADYRDVYGNETYIEGPGDNGDGAEYYWRVDANDGADYAEDYAPSFAQAVARALYASGEFEPEPDDDEEEDDDSGDYDVDWDPFGRGY